MGDEGCAAITATWAQAFAWRVRRHFLDVPSSGGPIAIARRLEARNPPPHRADHD